MTHYILTISNILQNPIAELTSSISRLLEAARSNYAKHKQYKNTVKELSRLSDAELLDIGLSRYDVEALALQTAYGRKLF